MSWYQWVASMIMAFIFTIVWAGMLVTLLTRAKKTALEVVDYFLARKKAIIAELEEQMEEAGKKKTSGSNYN